MPSSVTHTENLAIIEEICSFFVPENALQTISTCYQEKFQHARVGPYSFKSFIFSINWYKILKIISVKRNTVKLIPTELYALIFLLAKVLKKKK